MFDVGSVGKRNQHYPSLAEQRCRHQTKGQYGPHGCRLGSTVGLQSNNRPIGKPVRERMTALGRFLVLVTVSAAAVGQSAPDLQQLAGAIVQNDLAAARLI